MRATLFNLVVLTLLLLLQSPLFASTQKEMPESSAIERARQKVLERGKYETQLPTGESSRNRQKDSGSKDFSWMDGIGPFVSLLIRLLIAFAIIFGIIFLIREYRESEFRGRSRGAKGTTSPAHISGEDFKLEISDIRGMAAENRFSEAIHALLLRTVHELCRLADIEIRESKTSREIVKDIPLDEPPRQDLVALVAATEVSHFGLEEATQEDFDACLGHFESFVHGMGGTIT